MKDFLAFVKEDNPENNSESNDEYVRQLQQTIRIVKENRAMERGYMAWIDIRDEIRDEIKDEIRDEIRDEIKDEIRDEIRDEIKDEIRDESIIESKRESVLDLLRELGEIPENLESIIMSEFRNEVLRSMVKIASKATSFSDFQEKIVNL